MHQRLTSRTILLSDKNKILLIKTRLNNGFCWITPGGKIEEGETPFEAAQREPREETGITNAEFVTPHSWYYETTIDLHGIPTLFKEHIFLARTQQSQTTIAYLNEDEKEIIYEHKWWDMRMLVNSGEIFLPRQLTTFLEDIVLTC